MAMKLVTDTHTHTISSGHAYSTIVENCKEAYKNGMKLIAMTDHGPAMPGGPHIFHLGNMRVIPDVIENVEVLKGAEVNIIDYNGKLDLTGERIKPLDIALASLHNVTITPGSVRDNTNAIINAMKTQLIDVLGHIGNPEFAIDIDEVLAAARDYNVLIEINNSSLMGSRVGSYENCYKIICRAAEQGNKMVVSSDAHICYAVGKFEKAEEIIEKTQIPKELILSYDENRLKEFLRQRGRLSGRNN